MVEFFEGKYAIFEAVADDLRGKWTHKPSRFYVYGGHAMIFETFAGKKYFSLHYPNVQPNERAMFIPYEETERKD